MDDWNDDFREPTAGEITQRRVLALAVACINAGRPLGTAEIRRNFYEGVSDVSFRKTFLRDQARLAESGLYLRKSKKGGVEATYEVDEDASFARENVLDRSEATLLATLLSPLAERSEVPYARDLRLALAKIDHSFDGTSQLRIPPSVRRGNKLLERIEAAVIARHALRISYQRKDKSSVEREVAPYGLFCLHDDTYLVAAKYNGSDFEDPHTYRLDRILDVRPLTRVSFEVPADFDVADYIKLPFQMGPARYKATFIDDFGEQRQEEVNDEDMAARWAITQGLRPIEPDSLVLAWHSIIQQAIEE